MTKKNDQSERRKELRIE